MDPCQAERCQEARSPAEPRQEEPSLVVQCRAEHYLVERCLEALSLAEPCPAGPFLVEPSQAERCLEISVELKTDKVGLAQAPFLGEKERPQAPFRVVWRKAGSSGFFGLSRVFGSTNERAKTDLPT